VRYKPDTAWYYLITEAEANRKPKSWKISLNGFPEEHILKRIMLNEKKKRRVRDLGS
jgi:hypothetical protein